MIKIFKNKMFNKENRKYTILVVTLMISIITVIIFTSIKSSNNTFVINKYNMLSKLGKNKIGVYIDGEVNKTGYIQIPKGSTLEYAINKAEGITKDADIQNIDLRKVLKNQEKIIIPAIKEDIDDDNEIEENQILNSVEMININTATLEELTKLDGIGEKTAQNIIEYRQENEFDSIEEILEVKGIGEGKYNKIKNKICV